MKTLKHLLFMWLMLPPMALQAQNISLESLRDLPSVSGGALSPDGNLLLYTVSLTDIERNSRRSTVYLLNLSNNQKTEWGTGLSDYQWSPDGKMVAYRASRAGKQGIYVKALASGDEKLVAEYIQSNHFTGHPTKKNYAWSPDGKYIAYVAADPATGIQHSDANAPREIERTMYKSRTTFSDNRITRIYIASVSGNEAPKAVTSNSIDSHSLTWSPDSKQIAFLANHTENPDHNYNNDIFIFDIPSAQTKRLTDTQGTEHDPNWAPNSEWIAYPATIRPMNTKDSPPEDTHIYLKNTKTGELKNLTQALDTRFTAPNWSAKGDGLYFSAGEKGSRIIHYYDLKTGQSKKISKEGGMAGLSSVSTKNIAFSWNTPNSPSELYVANLDGTNARRVTFETDEWLKGKTMSKTEDFWFPSFDGVMVHGFISYPANVKAGEKLPVIHRIHGGPHGMYGFSFTDLNEVLVSKGYAVVFLNPRGSSGYGQRFSDGTIEAWGGGDYRDLMLGMDYALEKYPFLDKDRMGVTGGSYGGFMTNWVVTQTNRYKAAVTSASVSNLISFYGTSLYQDLIETEFLGMPWDKYDLLWHFSPMAHVKNVKTPTLLLHGEDDIDVPITQAEEFFIALRKLGVPTRFVRYPNEGHGVSQPQHREHYNKEFIEWFDKYLMK